MKLLSNSTNETSLKLAASHQNQEKNSLNNQQQQQQTHINNYIQMANLTSGATGTNSNCSNFFLNNSSLSTRSSFRSSSSRAPLVGMDDVGFIDENNEPDSAAVYNFPWDFKTKNPLLLQIQPSSSSSALVPPPLPSVPPPPTPKLLEHMIHQPKSNTNTVAPPRQPPPPLPPPLSNSNPSSSSLVSAEQDESQYCAPWDLKLQEELLKKMAQQQQSEKTANNSTNNESNTTLSEANTNGSFKRTDPNNASIRSKTSIKPNKSSNELNSGPIEPDTAESNEYSPPWEHKQSLLLQNLAAGQNASAKTAQIGSMPPPLATSSTNSTLTNQASQNSAVSVLINQFSRTRLSTRSNTSSSSSTHSSTSSLSTNSPPSVPASLPPNLPPPPPPPLSASSTNEQCKSMHRCMHSNSQLQQQQHVFQQSPRLAHRQLSSNRSINLNGQIQMTACNGNGFAIVPATAAGLADTLTNGFPTAASGTQLVNTLLPLNGHQSSILVNQGGCHQHGNHSNTYLNDKNKFCSWGSNCSSNVNSFETLTSNCVTSFDDTKPIMRQSRGGSSHHFVYPTQHFQTVPSTNPLISNDIQVAMPVTALVFSQTSSLPSNMLPLNVQQQQQGLAGNTLPSPSQLNSVERQPWFHGRITRKHAETMLANKPIGCFLVRQSESGSSNDFSLSLVSGSGCVHMRICMKNGEFILGQCSQPFTSIIKMIEHYGKVEVPIKGAQHVKLTMGVSAAK